MAGGRSCHHQTWGSNPQYLISCQRETTAIIALLRPDVRNSLLPQPYDPRQCIGVTVCTPQSTAEGLGRRAAVWDAGAEVYAESDFTAMDEAVLLMQLQPEVPYLLAPSTAEPGGQGLVVAEVLGLQLCCASWFNCYGANAQCTPWQTLLELARWCTVRLEQPQEHHSGAQ
eukprot:GHUV01027799.1.p1 GENE.GHUV01027799.1~~GHUV01027799.1.p1  ORF type:complete len:171 (-),score=47.02 GHUV01027799.1:555-1067(-)